MKFSSRWLVLLTSHISLLTSFSIAPLLLVTPAVVRAQWEPDVRLTFNDSVSSSSTGNARSIAAGPGSILHVVWRDDRDRRDYGEIYYKRSTDNGSSWSQDFRLTYDPAYSGYPTISRTDSFIHIVWFDEGSLGRGVYYMRSSDQGSSWSPARFLSRDWCGPEAAALSTSGSDVHVAWIDLRDGNEEVYYKRSTDEGATWSQDFRLTYDPSQVYLQTISSSDTVVHLVWGDGRDNQLHYLRSTDRGTTWPLEVRLTDLPARPWGSSVSSFDSYVHVVWTDFRDTTEEIYYKRSTDYGLTWEPDFRLSHSPDTSLIPSIASLGPNVHVTFLGRLNNSDQIYYTRSSNQGMSWSRDSALTESPSSPRSPSLALFGPMVHMVWYDLRDGNFEIYYKRNPTGNLGVEDKVVSSPISHLPFSVRPNPFTTFATLPGHESVRFALYDISGRKAGVYRGDRVGEGLAAGVYFLKPEGKDAKPLRIIKLR